MVRLNFNQGRYSGGLYNTRIAGKSKGLSDFMYLEDESSDIHKEINVSKRNSSTLPSLRVSTESNKDYTKKVVSCYFGDYGE